MLTPWRTRPLSRRCRRHCRRYRDRNPSPGACDIASGASEDLDANSIPDDCECLADIENDTFVAVTDLLLLLARWGPCPPVGDCFGDIDNHGTVAVPDLLRLLAAWGPCQ